MNKISQLEKESEQIFPATIAGAVSFNDGENAEQKIRGLKYPDKLSGPAYKVLAEHIVSLYKRVEALEESKDSVNELTANSVDTRNGFYYNGDKTVLSGAGAPSVVPGFIGQFYVDTTNKKLYVATGNSASTDWTILN